jgi:hypothetical protein
MAHPLGHPAVGVERRLQPPGVPQRAVANPCPELRGQVEADVEGPVRLVDPKLLLDQRGPQQGGRVRLEEEMGGPGALDVVDGFQLVLDLVDQGELGSAQLGSPRLGGSSPASTRTVSSASLPVRRHDS